jgi:hypothetical protein
MRRLSTNAVDKSVGEVRGIGARALLQDGFGDVPQIWAVDEASINTLIMLEKIPLRHCAA